MKIEIDLNDILGDENGVESMQESVRRQVIENLSSHIKRAIHVRVEQETSKMIADMLNAELAAKMPALLDDVLNAEYVPVDRYGARAEKTSFRTQLVKTITEQMVYKKTTYASDASAFTQAVDKLVAEKVGQFKADFNKTVDAEFTAQVMAHASAKLREKLGISK